MIPIVLSTDHNYVMPTGVTLCSLLLHSEAIAYDIYIMIGEDVVEKDKKLLTEQVKTLSPNSRITFIEMCGFFSNAHETRGITKATYYRLMIPWVIPHIDKIIYCDVDMIFKTSLKELYNIDLNGKYLGGVLGPKETWKQYKRYFDKIGADYTKYVNAGILVFNSKLQREANLNKEYELLSKKKFLYQDQDILNIVCKDKVAYFDRKYNLIPALFGTEEKYSGEVVIHYAGEKPWETFTYAWTQWWDIYNKSLFKEYNFNHKISSKILNPFYQLHNLLKKGKIHVQLLIKRLF